MILALVACGAPPEASADGCAGCHAEVHEAWSASAHGRGPSEVFDAWLPEVEAAWGEPAAARCVGCHEPGFVAGETVGCAACHLAVGNRAERDGELVVDLGAPLAGRASLAPHDLSDRALLRASALCSTCHEVTGPGLLVETTGSEHAAWGGAETCADCHLAGHTFDPLAGQGLAVSVEVHDRVARVTVENVAAGHAVPTGPAALRDVWVELSGVGRVLELGPRPALGDEPVALLTDADHTVGTALLPGESRTVEVPLPDGLDPASVTASVRYARVRREAAAALGLP